MTKTVLPPDWEYRRPWIMARPAPRRHVLRLCGLGLVAWLTGCRRVTSPGETIQPIPIYPDDTCARCHMLIDDLRQAAEILTRAGDVWKLGDLGELFVFYQERHLTPADVTALFVHDYPTGQWLPARQARYVISREIHSDMNFHVAAFAEPATAQQFVAAHQGVVHSFAELLRSPPRAG